jgi:hypothetical protein
MAMTKESLYWCRDKERKLKRASPQEARETVMVNM